MSGTQTFKISRSTRRFRFNPDALMSHAPRKPGVYEFLAADKKDVIHVLFVGWAPCEAGKTVYSALKAHFMGRKRPSQEDLRKAADEIYFDFFVDADVSSPEDFKDIAGALIARLKPRLNSSVPPRSGRYESVSVTDSE